MPWSQIEMHRLQNYTCGLGDCQASIMNKVVSSHGRIKLGWELKGERGRENKRVGRRGRRDVSGFPLSQMAEEERKRVIRYTLHIVCHSLLVLSFAFCWSMNWVTEQHQSEVRGRGESEEKKREANKPGQGGEVGRGVEGRCGEEIDAGQ